MANGWSVIGHEQAVESLARSVREGRAAHAYLIAGPAGTGKTRLALDLARALNCSGGTPLCGVCRACRLIESGRHPDVEVMRIGGICDDADHDHSRDASKEIKICQVRRIERVVSLQPFEGRTRVVVVEPAEAMNTYAADAFLKTLEEPPDQVVLILIAVNEAALLETIVSRCRRVVLGTLPLAAVRGALVARGVEEERAELLARLSGGRIGWALARAGDGALLAEREQRLQRLEELAGAGRAARMAFAAELAGRFAKDRQDAYAYLDLWQSWWRDLLLVREGCEQLAANSDRLPALRAVAVSLSPAAAVRALQALRDCRRQLEENANARLALEVLALRLPEPVTREEAGSRATTPRA